MTATMARTKISPAAIELLQAKLRGELVQPGESGYEEARKVYNALHDRFPAVIV